MNKGLITYEDANLLIEKFGSPLYIYFEDSIRKRAKEMSKLLSDYNYSASFACKANSNINILKIIKEEGLGIDAVSPGEIAIALKAGFEPEKIFFVSNNAKVEEYAYAVERGVLVSVDSLSSLEIFGRNHRGADIAIRINPGIGDGHSANVTTSGKGTKFGIEVDLIPEALKIIDQYELKLVGLNQHIGSQFLNPSKYVAAARIILDCARNLGRTLKFIDFGGGFGVPYKNNETTLDLSELSTQMELIIADFYSTYPIKDIVFKTQPGRYVVAESGSLLGTVTATKRSYGERFIGSDIGFNVLMRPTLYGSYHQVDIISPGGIDKSTKVSNLVGNICESGDYVAKDRELPKCEVGDIVVVHTTGAYGFSMSSNYNLRPRPAEVLIKRDKSVQLIRKAQNIEDLF